MSTYASGRVDMRVWMLHDRYPDRKNTALAAMIRNWPDGKRHRTMWSSMEEAPALEPKIPDNQESKRVNLT